MGRSRLRIRGADLPTSRSQYSMHSMLYTSPPTCRRIVGVASDSKGVKAISCTAWSVWIGVNGSTAAYALIITPNARLFALNVSVRLGAPPGVLTAGKRPSVCEVASAAFLAGRRDHIPDLGRHRRGDNDMSWLPITPKAAQPSGHAPAPGHAKTYTSRNARSRTLALDVVPQRTLLAQSAHGARATDHQVGSRCFK